MRHALLLSVLALGSTATPTRGEVILTEIHVEIADILADFEGMDRWSLMSWVGSEDIATARWYLDESDIGHDVPASHWQDDWQLFANWLTRGTAESDRLTITPFAPRASEGPLAQISVDQLFVAGDVPLDSWENRIKSITVEPRIEIPGPNLGDTSYTPTSVSILLHNLSRTIISTFEDKDTGEIWHDYSYGIDFSYRIYGVPEPTAIIHLAALLIPMSLLRFRR